mgnify:CR=1 FL=1
MAWNDLTNREKQLDKLIDGCGVTLDSSNSCAERVARAIGANNSELVFIRKRIALRLRTAEILGKSYAFITNTEQTLNKHSNSSNVMTKNGVKEVGT